MIHLSVNIIDYLNTGSIRTYTGEAASGACCVGKHYITFQWPQLGHTRPESEDVGNRSLLIVTVA